ncbi:hypothetical protein Q2T76_06500 [Lactobacillus sp. YT155]|uniref:hypothetical protein n=1 Tax=Lactobacillus sp. YT155 TaxID=3060955 RepID=UPI00265FC66E|nr:hypothetical protein [Lactobacillus sp. YT155]MDO1605707.1 hypothetical protein [Lactobacillus sp. YT155]
MLAKKPIEKITIVEVTTLAKVNRRTFYVYYEDIYDLKEQVEDDTLTRFLLMVNDYSEVNDDYGYFRHILKFVSDNLVTFDALYKNSNSSLMSKVAEMTIKRAKEVLKLKVGIDAIRALNFVCWGTIGFLEDTVLKSHKFEEKDVEQLTTMVSNILMPYIEL